MLNDYDEWHCGCCGKQVYWCELVFTEQGGGVCDTCYEESQQ